MNSYFIKIKIITAIFLFALLPSVLFAQTGKQICSSDGYTITTINGVFTDENGAIANRDALKYYFDDTYNGETLTVHYLLNPSHLGGIGDLAISVYQKLFESETVADYDLVEMLKDASAKVQTQKLLLVAHSQGNFYANSFYDTIVDKVGGVPAKALGVYSVANPASRVAGKGKWLTSDTDNVIAGLVSNLALFHSIMPTNTHIAEVAGSWDPLAGHDFTQVYLKYRATDIVKGIQESLDKLSSDLARSEGTPCIDPPKISFAHKVEGAVLAVADPVANVGVTTVATTAKAGIFVVTTTVKAGVVATVWTFNTTVAVATWTFDTGVTIAKAVGNTAVVVSSTVYNAIASALSSGTLAGNNSAAVILATQTQPQVTQSSPLVSASNNKVPIVTQALPTNNQTAPVAPSQPQTVFVFEPRVQNGAGAPKLVFVGSFGGSGGAGPQVLGTQSIASGANEIVISEEPIGNAGVALATPALSAPQCAQTLATDGCLLATTTVRFEWSAVAGADHYLLNKNGAHATTTDTTLDISARDFSDYTLEVVAIGADGKASATSTQAVSVATIPIAINEIAWMGTKANWRDEWFEIKNNTSRTIDLSQWKLNAKDGTPHVELAGVILPRAYIIFERTDDNAVFGVAMHATSTGDLNDDGDQITLSRSSTTFDQTPIIIDDNWAAGTTTTRSTMERYSSRESGADPSNWGTNLGYIKNGKDANGDAIEGTPGAQNSVSTLINKGQDITNDFTLTADEERYVVPSQILVTASSTLTVLPGVEIKFYHGGLWVNGAIDAHGTQENPIIFDSFSTARDGDFWIDNSVGTSTFEHARFENMNNVFVVTGGALEIRNSEFVNTDGGVDVDGASSTVLIENTNFASSTSDTIGVYNGGTLRIASSTITNQLDNNAIYLDRSSLVMASTTIDGVHDGNGVGAYDSFVSIASSTVRNTEGDAIWLSNSTTTIANTVVQGGELNDEDGTSGISIYGGVATITDSTISGFVEGIGIAVTKPTKPVLITGGEVTGNATGVGMYPADAAILTDVFVHDNPPATP